MLDAYSELDSNGCPTFSQYDFTDVSAGFFEAAKEKFGSCGNKMKYRKLDVEVDPS